MANYQKLNKKHKLYEIHSQNAKGIMDSINQKYTKKMCVTCKFYKDRCTKQRIPRNCADKGLKNKE